MLLLACNSTLASVSVSITSVVMTWGAPGAAQSLSFPVKLEPGASAVFLVVIAARDEGKFDGSIVLQSSTQVRRPSMLWTYPRR